MISMLCPTRNRPKLMRRFCESIMETAADIANIEVVFYIDDDDTESVKMAESLKQRMNVVYQIGARVVQSNMTNLCYNIANGIIVMMAGDDLIFRTHGWDIAVINVFDEWNDKIGIVFCDDGYHGNSFATHPFMHKNWVEALGYVCPGYFVHAYADRHNWIIANSINRCRYIPFLVEHMHHSLQKSEFDETARDLKQKLDTYRPDLLFLQTTKLREKDIDKLQDFIKANK